MELYRETNQFVMEVALVKLIVTVEGVFLPPQILIIEAALSTIVVGLTLDYAKKQSLRFMNQPFLHNLYFDRNFRI
ncbi:hypothetical protein LR48_Vigan01g115200 [Vigna angularis]|uniref:Uncharacterized protein n=1 Tax=Phaseolus angularis TaxID=3914 RepID=A0A0L9TMD5_PHAAN|nr:hypothetical protein LR48_Vigan01g115200 [Vigna angularis]